MYLIPGCRWVIALQMWAMRRGRKGASMPSPSCGSRLPPSRSFSALLTGLSLSAILLASFSITGPVCRRETPSVILTTRIGQHIYW